MKKKAKKLRLQQNKRNDQIEAGAYDGRYREKVVVDKKKKASKMWARLNK